jgi:hypothetical protein
MNGYDDEPTSYYDTAQVCLNGHVTNDYYHKSPVHNVTHCPKCGEQTIVLCPACKTEIRGSYEVPGVIAVGGESQGPGFCHKCGKPYPWTEMRLQAAKDYADELDELNPEEKEQLKGSLDELIRQTPRTEVASLRFKKVVKKVGKESYEGMKHVLTDLVSETVKKAIFGP